MVEEAAKKAKGRLPNLIRIQVSPHSHLALHSHSELQNTFYMAARGTLAEHAKLEILHVVVSGQCLSCGQDVQAKDDSRLCPKCGKEQVDWEDHPEVVIKDVECTLTQP